MQSRDCVEQIYPLVGDDGCVWEQRAHMDIVGVEIKECFRELYLEIVHYHLFPNDFLTLSM